MMLRLWSEPLDHVPLDPGFIPMVVRTIKENLQLIDRRLNELDDLRRQVHILIPQMTLLTAVEFQQEEEKEEHVFLKTPIAAERNDLKQVLSSKMVRQMHPKVKLGKYAEIID